jgi:hypothetical protein
MELVAVIKVFLNEKVIIAGLAWIYTRYGDWPICERWRRLESEARAGRIKLWADPNCFPPWKFRQQRRK